MAEREVGVGGSNTHKSMPSTHDGVIVTYGYVKDGQKVSWRAAVDGSAQFLMTSDRIVDVDFEFRDNNGFPSIGMDGAGVFSSYAKIRKSFWGKVVNEGSMDGECQDSSIWAYVEIWNASKREMRAVVCDNTVVETPSGGRFLVRNESGNWVLAKIGGRGMYRFFIRPQYLMPENADDDTSDVVSKSGLVPRSSEAHDRRESALNGDAENLPMIEHDYDADYGKLDYGMPRRCAFAMCVKGGTYARFRENLTSQIRWYMPGIDILDIDIKDASRYLGGIEPDKVIYFAKLAIPLMEQFKRYDRVIFMDVDIDIISGMFAGILSVETSKDGIAAAADGYQRFYRRHMNNDVVPKWDNDTYFNAGVLVLDLYKINKEEWRQKLASGISGFLEKGFRWRDQDLVNGYFSISDMGRKYNCLWIGDMPKETHPYAIHYCNPYGTKRLQEVLSCPDMRNADESIDAVFVIGSGSRNKNEELRYALRNLDAHCKFVRNVYICGECPEWVDKSTVRHLPWPDRFKHAKDANIIDKLRHACETRGVAKRILFCSDDQFQTRACTWEDFYPRCLRRYVPGDSWYDDRGRVWHTRLRKTLERDFQRRKDAGLNTENVCYWQPHIWMPVDRDKFVEYAQWCDYEHRDDTIIASGYFNFVNSEPRQNRDHVFIGDGVSDVPNVLHIAYTDGGSYESAMLILKKLFPSRCRFEMDLDYGSEASSLKSAFAARLA